MLLSATRSRLASRVTRYQVGGRSPTALGSSNRVPFLESRAIRRIARRPSRNGWPKQPVMTPADTANCRQANRSLRKMK
jgi:hypothetical protein